MNNTNGDTMTIITENIARLKELPRERIGMGIIMTVLVLSQFLSIELFTISHVVITFEKISALVLYPLAIYLIGFKNIQVKMQLVLFAFLLYSALSLFFFSSGEFDGKLLAATMTVAINGMVALLVYSACRTDAYAVRYFFLLWIICAVASSLICIAQVYQILPIIDSPGYYKGVVRAEGLLNDPNYQAGLLLIGFGALITLHNIRFRYVLIGIVLLGLVSTSSRMGFLGYTFLTLISPFFNRGLSEKKHVMKRFSILIMVICIMVLLLVLPTRYQIVTERINSTFSAIKSSLVEIVSPETDEVSYDTQRVSHTAQLVSLNFQRTSSMTQMISLNTKEKSASKQPPAPARFLLDRQAWKGFLEHIKTGIGLGNTVDYMKNSIGKSIRVHNVFLEILLIGGIAGACFLLYSGFIVIRFMVHCFPFRDDELEESIFIFVVSFCIIGMFLSLVTYVLPWIVFVFAQYAYETHNDRKILLQGEVL